MTSAAINHDAQFQQKSSKPSEKVSFHNHTDLSDSNSNAGHGIDSSNSAILANMTKQSRSKDIAYFMPIEKRKKLTPKAHEIWSVLPKEMKAVVLSNKKHRF